MAHDLRPFRDYDEKDVINLFSYNETTANILATPVIKGTLVEISTGWDTSQNLGVLESVGAEYDNTVSNRWTVPAKVVAQGTAGSACLGVTLLDIREDDENGELLKFNPRKAAEMQAVLVGQAVPILTKGILLLESDTDIDGGAAAGTALYSDSAGEFSATAAGNNVCVGRTLGSSVAVGSLFHTLIQLNCDHVGTL